MVRAAGVVLSHTAYTLLAIAVSVFGLTAFVVSLNLTIVDLALTGTLPTGVRLAVLMRLYPFVGTTFGPIEGGVLTVVSVTFGVDVAMLTDALRDRQDSTGSTDRVLAAAVATLIAAVATVGTPLVALLLSGLGVSGVHPVLPLAGFEFVLLALVAVLLSIHWLSDTVRPGVTGRLSPDHTDT